MKLFRTLACIFLAIALGCVVSSCGKEHKEGDGHDHEKKEGKGDGHGHGEEAPAGASFKPGNGVILTEETRKILGLTVADVTEEKLPRQIQFVAQVYDQSASNRLVQPHEKRNSSKASGTVSQDKAEFIKAGLPVRLASRTGAAGEGTVVEVHKGLAAVDPEVDITLTNTVAFKSGEFLSATITVPRNEAVPVIPKAALLRSSEGTFAYTVNGNAFFRTAVKTGAEADGKVEVTDGLLAGDQVVTKPVEGLWLIELRATKGGGHSH